MTENEFWELIAEIDLRALEHGDERKAVHPVQLALFGKQESELVAFSEILAQKLYAIDGEVYAKHAGEYGTSDDPFLYARLYVVARGRRFYEGVRSHPERMPQKSCEWLLYVHKHAWATLTGNPVSEWPYSPSVSYESGSNPALWPPSPNQPR